ncbi:MAG: hypothetical protein ACFFB3_15735 [Candidatus Hodarchaeota archaeon]
MVQKDERMNNINELHLVYIHGMYEQEKSFCDQFHKDLRAELGADETDYSGPKLIEVPIHWYPKVKNAMIEYPKISPHLASWKRRTLCFGLIPLIITSLLYIFIFEARNPIENLLDVRSTLGYATLLLIFFLFLFSLASFFCGVAFSLWKDREQLGIRELLFWIVIYLGAIWLSFNGAKEEDLLQQLMALFLFAVLIFLSVPILLRVAAKVVDPLAIQMIWYSRGKRRSKENDEGERFNDLIKKEIAQLLEEKSNVVFIAHSLGSVIAFDCIFANDFKKARARSENSPCNREIDLELNYTVRAFFSMGSPIPIFTTALLNEPKSNVCLPSDVKWYNLYDPQDPLARQCEDHFPLLKANSQIFDIKVNTGLFPFAHFNYWKRPWWRKIFLKLHIPSKEKYDPVRVVAKHIKNCF